MSWNLRACPPDIWEGLLFSKSEITFSFLHASWIYLISLGLGRCSVSILSFLSSELLELKLNYLSILCFSALEQPGNSSHNAVKLFDSVCILLKWDERVQCAIWPNAIVHKLGEATAFVTGPWQWLWMSYMLLRLWGMTLPCCKMIVRVMSDVALPSPQLDNLQVKCSWAPCVKSAAGCPNGSGWRKALSL